MLIDLPSIMFYVFAAVVSISALAVVSARNPVHSVFFLILAFFNAAGLFVLLGAEYLAFTLVIVYVGAVAVLFLFVVMMLNIDFARLRAGFLQYLPVGTLVALLLFVEIGTMAYISLLGGAAPLTPVDPIPPADVVSNTEAIGNVLYTNYILLFQLAGIILLVAMIGAIVLTLRHRPDAKRQRIAKQVSRTRAQSIEIVDVKSGEGA